MKIFFATFLALLFAANISAQNDKYISAVKNNLQMIDTASSTISFQKIANNFERIANAEKDKWLPYYYAAYLYTISSFIDSSKEKKDIFLDKAESLIDIADSLENDNSEIYTLKGFIAQARLSVDPMQRWQKYGPISSGNLNKAKELDPTNPRPDFLIGQNIFYTPEQFGGGKTKALPILKSSLEKYESFEPKSEIHPNWGKERLIQLLNESESSED